MFHNGNLAGYKRIVMKCGYTDLRCGIASLTNQLEMLHNITFQDNEHDTLYLFCGRSCKKIKGLIHSDKGFILATIELESKRVQWIRNSDEFLEITEEQLGKILRGERIR